MTKRLLPLYEQHDLCSYIDQLTQNHQDYLMSLSVIRSMINEHTTKSKMLKIVAEKNLTLKELNEIAAGELL